ncbi:MAG TPA: hypothetical protein VGS80_04120, partial [Ktedonobacterales bacterium]|nr:hypothetical protein [Ktedonobacterales bacterium]
EAAEARIGKAEARSAHYREVRGKPLDVGGKLLTLPTPKGGGCSGDVQPNGARSRLTGLPGPTVGWSVDTKRRR